MNPVRSRGPAKDNSTIMQKEVTHYQNNYRQVSRSATCF